MLSALESGIQKNQLFGKTQRLLLAISGGVDSVVLAHLLKDGGYNIALAHCNFQLRGRDSELDEAFCSKLAKQLNVPFYTWRVDAGSYSKKHKQSIQMAARELRYMWFDALVKEHGFERIVTAHHASDVVETVLINLLRGTGIKGLKGIPAKNGIIVRPLLSFTKEEIGAYAAEKKIKFRTDKSNQQDKYERNFLRLNVIPQLKKLHPELEHTFAANAERFAQEDAIVTDLLEQKASLLKIESKGQIAIYKAGLKKERHIESLLHFMLSPYGFNQTQQRNILKNIQGGTSGKRFSSDKYDLTIAKNDLVIIPAGDRSFKPLTIRSLKELQKQSGIRTEVLKNFVMPAKHEMVLSEKALVFPLTIRARKTGDKFKPFGMKGFKLVSDLLKEEKLNAFEKEQCRLLVNGNGDIMWVMGYRSDERYKVSREDSNLLKLAII